MHNLKIRLTFYTLMLAIACIIYTSCNSLNKTRRGAIIGAGTGGVIGAFIGKNAGNTALGAIIGGAVGGTAGAFIGRNMDRQAAQIKQTVPGATVSRTGEGILVNFDSGILFDVGKTDLGSEGQNNLKNLSVSLQNNPETNIIIIGHTDNTGSPAYNLDLSTRRASSVKGYLVSNGVDSTRLTVGGKGDTEPIGDNSTEAGRALNRRVEIIILANKQMRKQAEKQKKNYKDSI